MKFSLTLVILLWSFSVRAASCPFDHLNVGTFDFQPLYYLDQQQQIQGSLVSALSRVAQDTDCSIDFKFFSSVEGLANGLLSGDIDLMVSIRHPIFGQKMHYGKLPLLDIRLALYHLDHTPAATSLDQLTNRKLIVIRGYGYGGLAEEIQDPAKGIRFIVARDHDDAVQLLTDGKADYLLDYQGPVSAVIRERSINNIAFSQWNEESAYFITAKNNAPARQASEFLEQHWRAAYLK